VRGAVLNIGRGEAVRVRWLVDTLIAASGLDARVVEQAPATTSARGAGIDWQQIDPSAAHRRLGWQPVWALTDSVRALWAARAAAAGLQPASIGPPRGLGPRSTGP
jgi:dTDP-6-deoxy-L-talose 4-dehydrogenase [NAD(P)+]